MVDGEELVSVQASAAEAAGASQTTAYDIDFSISSDNVGLVSRKEHEAYHKEGKFAEVIKAIAEEIGAKQKLEDGSYDLRTVVQEAGDRIKTSYGELRIESDNVLVIIDSRFQKDHAGRGEYAVYARNESKAQHELAEIRGWAKFAQDIYIVTAQDIQEGRLGSKIRAWMNKTNAMGNRRGTVLSQKQDFIRSKSEEFHRTGLEAEFQSLIGS